MSQAVKAQQFADLHNSGDPIILYNIWDAGSAKAVAKTGAAAVATGSWSVAAAQGFADGEALPLDFLLRIVSQIVKNVDVPVTVDFEGGYATAPDDVAGNVDQLMETGVVGINFEDRIVPGNDIHSIADQSARIGAIRKAAKGREIPFFINARTDLFLREKDTSKHAGFVAEAKERAQAYADAGASGFFIPGLTDADLIEDICASSPLPVNVMKSDTCPDLSELKRLGVARVSYGPYPYFNAMADLKSRTKGVMES